MNYDVIQRTRSQRAFIFYQHHNLLCLFRKDAMPKQKLYESTVGDGDLELGNHISVQLSLCIVLVFMVSIIDKPSTGLPCQDFKMKGVAKGKSR